MNTYFAFSDETGEYRSNATNKFCSREPYYVRSAVLLDIESWAKLKNEFFQLKDNNHLPLDKEIKWSYLWSLKKHLINHEDVTPDKDYYFLRTFPLETLTTFVQNSFELMHGCNYCKIILTVTFNKTDHTWAEEDICKWHLQELMQRVEMEIQSNSENLAILFFDSKSQSIDKLLRDVYNNFYVAGDFIEKYTHIKDSISFELSHHSFGIQMADYTAGCFQGFMRGYRDSTQLFKGYVFPLIRRDESTGNILGYGIREVPRNDNDRSVLDNRLLPLLPTVD